MAARQWTDDRQGVDDNTPPDHGEPTHGSARFLLWAARQDRDVSVSELGDLYQEWRERRDDGKQADLGRWER